MPSSKQRLRIEQATLTNCFQSTGCGSTPECGLVDQLPIKLSMGRDQRKQQKQKKRERRNAEKKKYAQRLERRRLYPSIVFESDKGDPEFVEAVRAALATIDFDDPKLFMPIERTFYKLIRERGRRHAFGATNDLLRSPSLPKDQQEVTRLQLILGFSSRSTWRDRCVRVSSSILLLSSRLTFTSGQPSFFATSCHYLTLQDGYNG
jgi:hypothetical protein